MDDEDETDEGNIIMMMINFFFLWKLQNVFSTWTKACMRYKYWVSVVILSIALGRNASWEIPASDMAWLHFIDQTCKQTLAQMQDSCVSQSCCFCFIIKLKCMTVHSLKKFQLCKTWIYFVKWPSLSVGLLPSDLLSDLANQSRCRLC